ncbi:hypothetical protein QBC37DRAFT_456484 [Rhypophila decipiens]|uniref:Uncharacterized protein n=1 Tax=Rhypophila decipiens TaxID=261697 RepID=A0AAN6XX29_9PEZI|nr:hypothetical protein QBC37DRAFT_456484 [Rhypophila decipiens]
MPSPKPPSTRSSASDPASSGVFKRRGSVCTRNLVYLAIIILLGSVTILAVPYASDSRFPSHPFEGAVEKPPSARSSKYKSIAPFVFDSVQGFLQQWPNSYAPNGHSIVAGTIAPATVLYHAKHAPGPPKKPTFFAFDAEMSSTTRPLNIIYFDGQAATLTALGTLDSQISILQGLVPLYPEYDLVYDEDQRALDLCDLVKELGIDGVVRMDARFELLVCDYAASQLQAIFITNITVPGNMQENPKGLPHDPNRQPPKGFGNVFSEQGSYEWLRSASWHYGREGGGGPAESRVQLDVCRMVSFYDPQLDSLADSHHGNLVGNYSFVNGWGLRKGHRLLDIHPADVARVRSWLQAIVSPKSKEASCSGVNWQAIFNAVHSQHGTRAREIGAAFASWKSDTEAETRAIITKVHEITHAILAPYLEYVVVSDADSNNTHHLTPKEQTIFRCSAVYTAAVKPKTLNRSESLLYHSLNIVTKTLCTWEWDLFEWSEKRTTNYWDDQDDDDKPTNPAAQLRQEVTRFGKLTQDTLQWIGWDLWTKCDRQCMVDEICAIPTWPVVYAPGLPQGGIYSANPPRLSEQEMFEFWRPKYINRTDFDRGGGRGREPVHQFPDVPPY